MSALLSRTATLLALAATGAFALIGCGGGGPDPGTGPTASIGGTVRNDATDEPLAQATLNVGSVQATTDASGQFELVGVATGTVTLRVRRAGFATYVQDIGVEEGGNTHDVRMARQTVYEVPGFAVYLPPASRIIRGVILGLSGGDTRSLATGVSVPGALQSQRQMFLGLAATHGLAVMGSELPDAATSERVLQALQAVAAASDRPELALAPLIVWGLSAGAPPGYRLTLQRPERVIALLVIKGVTPSSSRSAAAQQVPGYVLLAELDEAVSNSGPTAFFVANRAEGALWAYALERGATHFVLSGRAQGLIAGWLNTVINFRLPETVAPGEPVALRSMDATSGWLGNRTTFAIAPDSSYADNKLAASWLPSQNTAESWQGFVTSEPGGGEGGE